MMSSILASGSGPTAARGNHRESTASSPGLRAWYPLRTRCSFSGVIARQFTAAPTKLGTKTCLQNGAYPSAKPPPAASCSSCTRRTNSALGTSGRAPA